MADDKGEVIKMQSWRCVVSRTEMVAQGYFKQTPSGEWRKYTETVRRRSCGTGIVKGATIDEALVAARAMVPKDAEDIEVWSIRIIL